MQFGNSRLLRVSLRSLLGKGPALGDFSIDFERVIIIL